MWDEIAYLFANFNAAQLKFWSGKSISSPTLLDMLLRIRGYGYILVIWACGVTAMIENDVSFFILSWYHKINFKLGDVVKPNCLSAVQV